MDKQEQDTRIDHLTTKVMEDINNAFLTRHEKIGFLEVLKLKYFADHQQQFDATEKAGD